MQSHQRVLKPSLLIIEDNASLSKKLKARLDTIFDITQTPSIETAISLVDDTNFAVVLIDRSLPDGDGIELVKFLEKAHPHTRVCILSHKSSTAEKINGLKNGADIYLTKPTSPQEVKAHLQALLRRGKVYQGELLHRNDLYLDPERMVAFRNGIHVDLTPRETQLLAEFLQAPGGFLSKAQLLDFFWDLGVEAKPSLIHVTIQRIRTRLKTFRVTIKTHYGTGYQLLT